MGGIIGQVYGAAEHGLTEQKKFDEAHPDQARTNGPSDMMYNDCSMTCGRISLPNEMQGIMGSNSFGVTQMDDLINTPLKYIDPTGLVWGTQDFQQNGHHYRRFTWFHGNKVGKGFTAFTPDKDGTVVALKGGGGARIYRNGGSETWPGPSGGRFNNDGLNLAAGHLHGIASAATVTNPLAQGGVDWAFSKIGGVDQSSALYVNGKAIGDGVVGGSLALAAPGLGELGGAGQETTTLYRAVSNPEFEQIMETGTFKQGPNALPGKWFWENSESAEQFGQWAEGKGAFKVVDAKIPTVQANKFLRLESLDGLGPARYGELHQLTNAVIGKGGP